MNNSRNSTPSRAAPRGRTLTGVSNRSPARPASTWWGTESWWSFFLRPDAKWVRVRFKPTKRYLVGGFNPSEKYESVVYLIPNIWKNKKCSKPLTRYRWFQNQKKWLAFCRSMKAPGRLDQYPNFLMFLPMGQEILIRSLRAHQKELPLVVKF